MIMLNSSQLLTDLQGLVRQLETDLLERSDPNSMAIPDVVMALQRDYERENEAKRTAASYSEWLQDRVTQIAVAWVLSCVFGRFLEDNDLVFPPKIAGEGNRLQRARDEHELYFRKSPRETDRDYLLSVFREWGKLPVIGEIFGLENPIMVWSTWLSGDGGTLLLRFF